MPGSKLFRRNRALGFVSNHVPACTRYVKKRKTHFVVTSVGRSFHMYECNHFRLIAVSIQHPDEITALACDHKYIFSSCGAEVFAWRSTAERRHTYKSR